MSAPLRKSTRVPLKRHIEEAAPAGKPKKIKLAKADEIAQLKALLAKKEQEIADHCEEKEELKKKLVKMEAATNQVNFEKSNLKVDVEYLEHDLGKAHEKIKTLQERNEKMDELLRANSENQAKFRMECEICLQYYDGNVEERIPRFLRCGHTICHGCASTLQQQSDGTTTPRTITCPYDRHVTRAFKVSSLPKNFVVIPKD